MKNNKKWKLIVLLVVSLLIMVSCSTSKQHNSIEISEQTAYIDSNIITSTITYIESKTATEEAPESLDESSISSTSPENDPAFSESDTTTPVSSLVTSYASGASEEITSMFVEQTELPIEYEIREIEQFDNGVAKIISNHGKYGCINTKGEVIVSPIYDYIFDFYDGMTITELDGKYGYIDIQGNTIVSPIYEDAEYFNDGRAMIQQNGKYGYINCSGELVIPAIYDTADDFFQGTARVGIGKNYGIIDLDGNIIVDIVCTFVQANFQSVAKIIRNGKTEYINKKGELVYQVPDNATGSLAGTLFYIETEEELISGTIPTITYYDEHGIPVFSFINARVERNFTKQGYAIISMVENQNYWSDYKAKNKMIDKSGNFIEWVFEEIENEFDSITDCGNGYFYFSDYRDSSWKYYVYIDFENQKVYPLGTDDKDYLGNDFYYTDCGYEYGMSVFSSNCKAIIKNEQIVLSLDGISEFADADIMAVEYHSYNNQDLFFIQLKSNSGTIFSSLIDINGSVLIKPTNKFYLFAGYEMLGKSLNLCVARDRESQLLGYVDLEGNWVIPPQYNTALPFYDDENRAVAIVDGNKIIDITGELIH